MVEAGRAALVFDAAGRRPDIWTARFPEEIGFRVFVDWDEVVPQIPRSAGLVIELAGGETNRLLGGLRRLDFYSERPSLVLITPRDPELLASVADIRVQKVLWSDAPHQEIRSAIGAAFAQLSAWETVESLLPSLPPLIYRAVRVAVESRPPFVSVEQWAAAVHLDRRVLSERFRHVVGRPPDLHPVQFVGWLLLRAAVDAKRPGLSWRGVARSLGTTQDRILRLGRSLMGLDARTLAAASVKEVDNAMLLHFGSSRMFGSD